MVRDPGWTEAGRRALKTLVFPWTVRKARVDASVPRLVAQRSVVLAIVISWFLFLVVLSFVRPRASESESFVVPAIVGVMGCASLFVVSILRRRQPDTRSERDFVQTYTTLFFLAFAVAELPVLIGFIGVFLAGNTWVYLIGLPFGLAGFLLIAPTSANLARLQRQVRERGSSLDVLEALLRPAGEISPG